MGKNDWTPPRSRTVRTTVSDLAFSLHCVCNTVIDINYRGKRDVRHWACVEIPSVMLRNYVSCSDQNLCVVLVQNMQHKMRVYIRLWIGGHVEFLRGKYSSPHEYKKLHDWFVLCIAWAAMFVRLPRCCSKLVCILSVKRWWAFIRSFFRRL